MPTLSIFEVAPTLLYNMKIWLTVISMQRRTNHHHSYVVFKICCCNIDLTVCWLHIATRCLVSRALHTPLRKSSICSIEDLRSVRVRRTRGYTTCSKLHTIYFTLLQHYKTTAYKYYLTIYIFDFSATRFHNISKMIPHNIYATTHIHLLPKGCFVMLLQGNFETLLQHRHEVSQLWNFWPLFQNSAC